MDGSPPKKIGYNHPTELLQEILDAVLAQQPNTSRYSDYEVVNCDVPGMYDGAYLVHRYRYSQRTFLARTDELPRRRVSERTEAALRDCGIFLQGVRVVDGSPGFGSEGPVAVINGLGKGVPRTNVARSGIEQDTKHATFFKSIYETYVKHAREEVSRWSAQAKSSSLTTRGRRISTSLRSLMSNSAPVHDKLLQQVLDEENRIVVEIEGERKLISINDMLKFSEFNTVESRFVGTAERLLENLSVSKSLRDITRALDLPDIGAQSEIILTEPSDNIDSRTLDSFCLGRVKFDEPSAQLSILWKRVAEDGLRLKRLVPDLKRHGLVVARPIVVVPPEVLANESNWPVEAVLICEYATFIHPSNPEIKYIDYLHADDVSQDERPDFKQAFTYALSQLWTYDDYERGRPLDETASAFGRGDAEGMLADLKEKIVPFREMRVIKIGVEDELLW